MFEGFVVDVGAEKLGENFDGPEDVGDPPELNCNRLESLEHDAKRQQNCDAPIDDLNEQVLDLLGLGLGVQNIPVVLFFARTQIFFFLVTRVNEAVLPV